VEDVAADESEISHEESADSTIEKIAGIADEQVGTQASAEPDTWQVVLSEHGQGGREEERESASTEKSQGTKSIAHTHVRCERFSHAGHDAGVRRRSICGGGESEEQIDVRFFDIGETRDA
jgi:hypothetical protein